MILYTHKLPTSIYVSLDDMTAESRRGRNRAFEIYGGSGSKTSSPKMAKPLSADPPGELM